MTTELPFGQRVRAYSWALARRWVTLLTGTILAAGAVVLEKALDVAISGDVWALVFLWLGGMIASFQAWSEENAKTWALKQKVETLTEQVDSKPIGPQLRLAFDSEDPLCVWNEGGEERIRVQVFNEGDRRADDVSVVLDQVFPETPKMLNQGFAEIKKQQETFSVSPNRNRPPVYVDVLTQRPHAAQGHLKRLAIRNAPWFPPNTSRVELVPRIEAEVEAEPLKLSFKEEKNSKLRVV